MLCAQREKPCEDTTSEDGWSLLEIMISMTVLAVALVSYLLALSSSMRLAAVAHEQDRAINAARQMVERLQAADFDDVFALYNTDTNDDPGGVGTAPGPNFAVASLLTQVGDSDGYAGRIIFPTTSGSLDETITSEWYGTPRDLDLNGDNDNTDSAVTTYIMVPVTVRIEWRGSAGDWTIEVKTLIVDR